MADKEMTNVEYANSLRLIADFFASHPEIPIPHDATPFNYFSANSKESIARLVRALGACEKRYDAAFAGSFEIHKTFGTITFRAIADRDRVCERVVVGKKTVPETVIPAKPMEPERVIAAHEEDVIEWRCEESILASAEPIDIDAPLAQAIQHDQQQEREAPHGI